MIKIDQDQVKKIVMYAVIINLIVPYFLKPFASNDEIKPPNGAASLSMKGQIMHMFVHHSQVPVSSSIIVAIIVALAVILNDNLKI